jgi:hypothetical protein
MASKKKVKFKHLIFILLGFVVATIVVDFIRISKYEIIPKRPVKGIERQEHDKIQYELANGSDSVDWTGLDGTLEYIRGEYDCSDFRLVNTIRLLFEADDKMPPEYKTKIENVLFNFRWWWDEPGANSMCYWSENHQILFASAEYLAGQLYPETIFPNSGLTGKQHMEKAKQRALDWFEMRWNYGYIEFNSEVYYPEDIGALINLIDFAEDEELVIKSQMAMDLIFYDVAVQSIHTMFNSASGRAYFNNRKGGPDSDLHGLTRFFWGDGKPGGPGMTYGMTTSEKYKLPPVLSKIAKDTSTVIIKQSNGLNISDLKTEGYYGTDNRSMMMQWAMECFTNPEVVRNSLYHIRNNIHFSNEFIHDMKVLDFSLLKWLGLEPLIVKMINPQSNGVAIQKGNTYTYKTNDYSIYTAQNYHPGTYGDQQHIFGMNIKNHFSIFHTHPAVKKDRDISSPNYNVGYGHIPHAAQDKNVSLAIYNIPKKKGLMEYDLLDFTRAYFPDNEFDTTLILGNYVFGKKENTYCAFIGTNDFYFADDDAKDDLIQPGKQTFWITEAGSLGDDGSFENFVQRIKQNKVEFSVENLELSYFSKGTKYMLRFMGDFKVDGKTIDTDYHRYDSPYAQAKKKDKTITIEYMDKSLFLDFENLIREFN